MNMSADGEALIKRFEGLRLDAYVCPSGVWTVGWGHTKRTGQYPHRISEATARWFFTEDVEDSEYSVRELCPPFVPTQSQFDALCSFVFNLGHDNFRKSTLLRKLRAGDTKGAADQFLSWVYGTVGGQKKQLPGLVTRRQAERDLFTREL